MPVLKSYTDCSGHYIRGSVHGSVITFQLTVAGFDRLSAAGIRPGDRFGLTLLADLTRSGDAYTRHGGPGFHEAEQFEFDFNESESRESERLFPACAVTGRFDDLHLVVHAGVGDGEPAVQLLAAEAREGLRGRILLSVPLPVLSLPALALLEDSGHVPPDCPVVDELRRWFRQSAAADWERLRREREGRQQALPLASPDELDLG